MNEELDRDDKQKHPTPGELLAALKNAVTAGTPLSSAPAQNYYARAQGELDLNGIGYNHRQYGGPADLKPSLAEFRSAIRERRVGLAALRQGYNPCLFLVGFQLSLVSQLVPLLNELYDHADISISFLMFADIADLLSAVVREETSRYQYEDGGPSQRALERLHTVGLLVIPAMTLKTMDGIDAGAGRRLHSMLAYRRRHAYPTIVTLEIEVAAGIDPAAYWKENTGVFLGKNLSFADELFDNYSCKIFGAAPAGIGRRGW